MDTIKEKKLVPRLRFGEYVNNWEIDKFSKYIKLYRGSSPRPISIYRTKNNGVNWIKIGDTKGCQNYVINNASEQITVEGSLKSRKVEVGELILANSMSFGKTYLLNICGCIYDGWFVLREYEDNFNKYFLHQLLNSEHLQKQYLRLSTGGVVQNISSEIVYSTILCKPSISEQQKIASFLSAIDKKIQQLTQKKELLEEYKKGVMQKIFSEELRFKDEFGNNYPDWEEKKLGDLCDITTGKSNREDSGLGGEYTFFDRSEDIRTSSIYLFDAEAVIVAGEGSSFPPKYFKGKFDLHQRTYAIMGFENLFGRYLFYYLHQYKNYFVRYAVGSTVKSLRLPIFKKMNIHLPSFKEQQKIASFLSSLDSKIDLVSTQIENTKAFKKGLLQQLFI